MQNITYSQISFKSTISPISQQLFNEYNSTIKDTQRSKYPWTLDQIVIGDKCSTKGIKDCTAAGITDGKSVILCHIAANEENKKNIEKLKTIIKNKVPQNKEDLQGFIVGSIKKGNRSKKMFEMIEGIFKDLEIEYTKLKGQSHQNDTHLLFDSTKDTLFISNKEIDERLEKGLKPKEIFNNVFESVKIADFDEIQE